MPPSDIQLVELLAALRHHGADCQTTKHGHYKAVRRRLVYTFPTVKGRHVKAVYVPRIRRALELDAAHGVDDHAFWGRP